MALLTARSRARIQAAVDAYHEAVAAVLYGDETRDAAALARARDLGLLAPGEPPYDLAEALHTYGVALAELSPEERAALEASSLESWRDRDADADPPLTPAELRSQRRAADRAALYVVGLGNRVGATIGSALIEADRELDTRLRGAMRDAVAARYGDEEAQARLADIGMERGLTADFFEGAFRETRGRLASDLGHATGDWTRDLERVARTESQNILNDGLADGWLEQDGPDTVVFKLPRPDACEHCLALHLDGGVPRLFYLPELEANGTNVGRAARQWLPVVGATHPYCGCALMRVPATFVRRLPEGWRSGQAAPGVVGTGGRFIMRGRS